jgi:hydrogenase/urease accessory protein HupE
MRLRHFWILLVAVLSPALVRAHEMSIAEMEVREMSRGEFLWQWSASNDKRAGAADLHPSWPDNCSIEANVLHCGDKGLWGTLGIDGVGTAYSAAIVKVFWLDGQSRVYTLTAGQPSTRIYGSADDRRGIGEIASAYTVLGIEHILSGFDHLAFVLALLFLVGFNRRLVLTISAFTLAHSVTLALSALGWLTLNSPPVEATIALSIMLVAAEALHDRKTLSRRWPALVAFLFGLVHGLGFAGALKEIGLPPNHLSTALLTFNVGVELGQLFVVGVALLAYWSFVRLPQFALARAPSLYVIGGVAAYWSIGRVIAIVA